MLLGGRFGEESTQRPHLDSCLQQLHLRSHWVRHRAFPKSKAPSREQVQIEVDTIVREVEKRAKRTSDEKQLHDAMLAAILKSVFEDTVLENYVGIYVVTGDMCRWGSRMGTQIMKRAWRRALTRAIREGHSWYRGRLVTASHACAIMRSDADPASLPKRVRRACPCPLSSLENRRVLGDSGS